MGAHPFVGTVSGKGEHRGLNDVLRALDPDIHERLDVAFIAEENWRNVWRTIRSAEFGGRLWRTETRIRRYAVQLRC